MFYKRYETSDLMTDSVFVNTLSESSKRAAKGKGQQLQADHSKLDYYLPEIPLPTSKPLHKRRNSVDQKVRDLIDLLIHLELVRCLTFAFALAAQVEASHRWRHRKVCPSS